VAKSPTEVARELALEVSVLKERDATRTRDVAQLRDELTKEREARTKLESEVSALKQQLQDHIEHTDTGDTRRWGLVVALVVALFGALCSLAAGLIVALARK
jgi:uncharacterized protein YlxW (UPF0749 family)